MKINLVLFVSITLCSIFISTNSISLNDVPDIKKITAKCMIEHRISPLTVHKLKSGDISFNDRKSQVKFFQFANILSSKRKNKITKSMKEF